MPKFDFQPYDLPPQADVLREQVRDFLARELADYPPGLRAHSWMGQAPVLTKRKAPGEAGALHRNAYLEEASETPRAGEVDRRRFDCLVRRYPDVPCLFGAG